MFIRRNKHSAVLSRLKNFLRVVVVVSFNLLISLSLEINLPLPENKRRLCRCWERSDDGSDLSNFPSSCCENYSLDMTPKTKESECAACLDGEWEWKILFLGHARERKFVRESTWIIGREMSNFNLTVEEKKELCRLADSRSSDVWRRVSMASDEWAREEHDENKLSRSEDVNECWSHYTAWEFRVRAFSFYWHSPDFQTRLSIEYVVDLDGCLLMEKKELGRNWKLERCKCLETRKRRRERNVGK